MSERLWSAPEATQDVNQARWRLDEMRCLMLKRGIPAAPILNGWCGDYELGINQDVKLNYIGDRVRL